VEDLWGAGRGTCEYATAGAAHIRVRTIATRSFFIASAIIGAIAELERSLIVERVRAGMRRPKLEGRHIGRKALVLDRAAIQRDRQRGDSLGQLAKSYLVSRTTIPRVLEEQIPAVPEGLQKRLHNPHRIKP
jgi:DNA invertase Pin-like site-specific DNA recombinase